MKKLLYFLKEKVKDIVCKNCGWSWDKEDSEEHDMYVCHKCGTDNKEFYETL
jgi:DNA-directed RNA polymerase subunit RPC12/RpoP